FSSSWVASYLPLLAARSSSPPVVRQCHGSIVSIRRTLWWKRFFVGHYLLNHGVIMSRARDTHGDENAYDTSPRAYFKSRHGGNGAHGGRRCSHPLRRFIPHSTPRGTIRAFLPLRVSVILEARACSRQRGGRLPSLHLRAVLLAASGEVANRLQAALEPAVQLAAGDIHVHYFVRPIEVLETGHEWMFGQIAGKLPFLAFAGRVLHVLSLHLQPQDRVLFQRRRFHGIHAFVVAHRNGGVIGVGDFDPGLAEQRVAHLVPTVTGDVQIEAPWHGGRLVEDDR